jgi:two-component system, OmpR family, sensor histidine kinase KdpD
MMKTLPAFAKILVRMLLAVCAIAIASVILIAFRDVFSSSVIALLYLLVVVFCTTIGGFLAGITASVLAFLAFNYFFLPPYSTFIVTYTQDTIALFVFLVVSVLISNLMGRSKLRLEQIEARERESTHLFELSSTLTGIRDEQEIAELLAQHVLAVFQADRVDVLVQSDLPDTDCQDKPCIQVRLPENTLPGVSYQHSQVLSTNRGVLGEIHLWTKNVSLTSNEKRLLQTIASQAALAVERTLFSRSENRAKILEESDRLKTAILSSVSHDLRTPLASIQAAASSLNDSSIVLEPKARDELNSLLLEEAEHLNQLVGNLLNMSRIEAGALKLQKHWNSMADLVDTAVERMQRQLAAHTVRIDVSEDLPLIQVDAILIEQVFINLLSNCIKFSPPGSQIQLKARIQDANWMEIVISNQGPGIPDEHLEHIFDKFYQFPGMKQESSTGLGLSICKGIVEAHGGQIWAGNSTEGLAFYFTLPLDKSASFQVPIEEMPGELEENHPGETNH